MPLSSDRSDTLRFIAWILFLSSSILSIFPSFPSPPAASGYTTSSGATAFLLEVEKQRRRQTVIKVGQFDMESSRFANWAAIIIQQVGGDYPSTYSSRPKVVLFAPLTLKLLFVLFSFFFFFSCS